jgi:S1-C subfamily serine protease
MFVEAIGRLSSSVHAFIESLKWHDPKSSATTTACTFIVLNKEGWILTAKHVVDTYLQAQADLEARKAYENGVKEISAQAGMSAKKKREQISALGGAVERADAIVAHTWYTSFGEKGPKEITFSVLDMASDLALGRMEGFDSNLVSEYPVFRNPDKPLDIGTPLCRLGFPFTEAPTQFDSTTGKFTVPNIALSRFPNDGIFTRMMTYSYKNAMPSQWLETSSPGLRGQSGGPIFDTNGHICAIQSHTVSLRLDFGAPHQYLNVGRGAYVSEVVKLLRQEGIEFQLAN